MKYAHLKVIVFNIILLVSSNVLTAQVVDTVKANEKINILKINVPALFLKNISLQYERKLGRKNSFAIAVRYRPKSTMPFQSTVEKLIDQPSVRVDLFKMGNFGVTPEYRFYVGKKDAPQGFYIGPFISYNHYNADIPVNYMGDTKTGVFVGGFNTFTAGFQLGAQWKLSEKIYLDWWIVGPNYGISKGDFVCNTPLNEVEQISMDFELFRIMEGSSPRLIDSYKVDANGASFVMDGPWAGIRAMGFNIGYRF
jgi:Protein of unknown function (DUF3575)